jgi:hypothetical protein
MDTMIQLKPDIPDDLLEVTLDRCLFDPKRSDSSSSGRSLMTVTLSPFAVYRFVDLIISLIANRYDGTA